MKKLDFATTLNETQSYIGELALPYITAAFLKNRTVDSGVRVVEDIIKYAYVAKLAGSNLVQVGQSCDFNASGTLTASEVKLEPCTLHIDIELCYKDLESLWNGLSSGNLNSQDAGADFQTALQGVLIDAMNQSFEDKMWNYTGTTGCTISGISTQITTNVVTGASALTKTNIVAAVDALVAELPSTILEDVAGLKIYMNPKMLLYYKQALMALGINTPADSPAATYDGIPIYTVTKIADNELFAIRPDNIVVGVGAMDNFSQLVIKDMRESTLDNKVRMKLQGNVDVKVIYEAEAAKWYKV
jgi:hypothetical protein